MLPEILSAQSGINTDKDSLSLFAPSDRTIIYKLGERKITLKILQYGKAKNFVCINLHDDESTSVEAAKSVLKETGGTLIKIENKNQRLISFSFKDNDYSIDPNRIFSRAGIEKTLRATKKISSEVIKEVEKFAQRLLKLIPDTVGCIIALHNNTDEAYSIKSYLPGNKFDGDAKKVYADSLQDVDDIILTTDSILYSRMAALGYNSIWQDNERAENDGSLSIYCGERNMRYINIETQHGKLNQYILMVRDLLDFLIEEKQQIPEIIEISQ